MILIPFFVYPSCFIEPLKILKKHFSSVVPHNGHSRDKTPKRLHGLQQSYRTSCFVASALPPISNRSSHLSFISPHASYFVIPFLPSPPDHPAMGAASVDGHLRVRANGEGRSVHVGCGGVYLHRWSHCRCLTRWPPH